MKKIISLIISALIVFTAIPIMTLSVSAETVNKDDTSIWCYVGSIKTANTAISADTIYYKADTTDEANHQYATINEALDAATNYYAENALSADYEVFLNQNVVYDTPYTLQPATTGKTIRMSFNGFSMTFVPTDTETYGNSAAFIIDRTKVGSFFVRSGATEKNVDQKTFGSYENNPFFTAKTGTFENLRIRGSIINGDLVLGNVSTMFDGNAITMYGNLIGNNTNKTIYMNASKSVFNGNVTGFGLVQIAASGTNSVINGDLNVGRFQAQKIATINGNVTINAFGEVPFDIVQTAANGTTVTGDLTIKGIDTAKVAIRLTGYAIIGGKTTITGKSANMTLLNSTFTGGIYNNCSNDVTITLDGTDKVGSVFYNEDEVFETVLNNYGASVSAPETTPVKDSFTFVGWTDENGELVDFDTAAPTQSFSNKYYAKFSSYTEKHIPVTTDNFYLPDANTLTRDGDKIVCYKDSQGNIATCGSLATKGETYDAITVNLNQLSGAQMRLNKTTSGIRFLSEINTADINTFKDNSLKITELGTKIAPEEYFSDSTKQDSDFLSVVATDFYEKNSETSTIAGSIIKIKDKNLNRNFIGQGYIKVKLPDGSNVTITAVLGNDQARSIYKISSLANQSTELSASAKEIIVSYLDSVVIINDGLITVPTGYETPYIYTGKKVIPNTTLTNTTANIRLVVLDSVNYYKDSDSAPLAAIITDDPDSSDVTDLRIEDFKVSITAYDGKTDTEHAILVLPKTYTDNGAPTRLIIDCHGFSSNINQLLNMSNLADGDTYKNLLYFAHQGYAVLAVEGGGQSHDAIYNMANVGAINGYVASYEYCLKNYNISKEVFVKGSSMGGLVSQNLITSGRVPVLAYVGDSPVTSFYRQLYCESWDNNNIKRVAKMYDFDFSNTEYTYDTFPFTLQAKKISDLERQLFIDNFKEKVLPVNEIWKYCQFFDNDTKEFKAGYEDFLTATEPARVQELYSSIAIDFPVPYLICHASIDSSVSYNYSKLFVDAINRGNGAKAVLKTYEVKQSTHCNLGDLTTYPCKDGSQFTAVSSFNEMLNFFRQYDK